MLFFRIYSNLFPYVLNDYRYDKGPNIPQSIGFVLKSLCCSLNPALS
jgi:hypothetical protein